MLFASVNIRKSRKTWSTKSSKVNVEAPKGLSVLCIELHRNTVDRFRSAFNVQMSLRRALDLWSRGWKETHCYLWPSMSRTWLYNAHFVWHPCVLIGITNNCHSILQPPFWGTLTLWKYIRRQKLDVWVGMEWSSCFRKLGADTRGLVDTIISYSSHLNMDGWKTSLFLSFSNRPSWQVRSAKC